MKNLLEVHQLSKCFGDKAVVKDISFSVKQGEILGFLGPNGAGKSTTLHMITTLLEPTAGHISFEEAPVADHNYTYKRALGLVPQDIAVFSDLTAYENVKFFCSLYGIKGAALKKAAESALDCVGLLDHKNEYPDTFSGGMKRRLNIACSIVHKPRLLIMDEPTVGIDPQSRNKILEVTKNLSQEGTTIIYTSHYMEEVEAICSRIIIIDHGEILEEGSLEAIKSKYLSSGADNLEAIFLQLTGTALRD